ncbi:cytochrome P450 [Pisolithus marmoratus]|nr:cytochrome P450 [Pisolithus marmoratus]
MLVFSAPLGTWLANLTLNSPSNALFQLGIDITIYPSYVASGGYQSNYIASGESTAVPADSDAPGQPPVPPSQVGGVGVLRHLGRAASTEFYQATMSPQGLTGLTPKQIPDANVDLGKYQSPYCGSLIWEYSTMGYVDALNRSDLQAGKVNADLNPGHAYGIAFSYFQLLVLPWVTYEEWGKRYGDLTYFQVLGKEYIIVKSEKVAHELLDQRSSIYSDRPRVLGMIPPTKLTVCKFCPMVKEWRQHRKALHLVLNRKEALKYETMQLRIAHELLANLLTMPQSYGDHIRRWHPLSDPALLRAFPFLAHIPSWMPGGYWTKRVGDCRAVVEKVVDDPVQYVHDSIVAGTARKSMVHDIYEDKNVNLSLEFNKDKVAKEVAATVFIGGMISFLQFLAYLIWFEAGSETRKAQEEINRVVGIDRLPDFGDRPNLPYVEAVLLETIRWVPVGPLGVVIIPNVWAMTHDPERFPEPKVFNPDRYSGKLEDASSSPGFGFGRHLAEQSLWAVIVSMLATLQIGKATDASGAEVEVSPKLKSGVAIRPEAFPCSIKARSSKAEHLIRAITTYAG